MVTNPLLVLVGKTISSVELKEIDMHDNGEDIRQFYIIATKQGDEYVFACNGGCDAQYARLEKSSHNEYIEFKEVK